MRRLLSSVLFLGIVLGAVIVLGLVAYCSKRGESAIPPKVQQELDSLRKTRQQDSTVIDSLKSSSRLSLGRSDSLVSKGHATLANADKVRQKAEEAAFYARQALSAQDSAKRWQEAYEARSDEADSLRRVVTYLDSANTERERARQSIQSALALSESRRLRSEKLNEDLAAVIKSQERGCRIVGLIRCPSRTVVGVVGLVGGVALGHYISTRPDAQ